MQKSVTVPKNYYFQLIDLISIFKDKISSMFGFVAWTLLHQGLLVHIHVAAWNKIKTINKLYETTNKIPLLHRSRQQTFGFSAACKGWSELATCQTGSVSEHLHVTMYTDVLWRITTTNWNWNKTLVHNTYIIIPTALTGY